MQLHWGASRLEYLGHIIGEGKVQVPQDRVQALKDFRRPRTKKQMRAFLGTVVYYRQYILKFAAYAYSLTKPTKKSAPNNSWTKR